MEKNTPKKPSPNKQINSYVKYTGLAFQMAAIIGLSVWLGTTLDKKYAYETPWFTIGCSFLGVVIGVYLAIKDFINFR